MAYFQDGSTELQLPLVEADIVSTQPLTITFPTNIRLCSTHLIFTRFGITSSNELSSGIIRINRATKFGKVITGAYKG